MKYLGSKNRLSKYIAPIIQRYIDEGRYDKYLEPFVGGANMIDKINCPHRYGSDVNKYLIALLKQAQTDASVFPLHVSEDEYIAVKDNKDSYDDWYVGLVGFCATFSGKFFGGYARSFKNDGVTPRDIPNETIRNILKQAPKLNDIKFTCQDFREIENVSNTVIYCDPPYRDTTKYKTDDFPYDDFYLWCKDMARSNIVLVSEYNMPDGFACIYEKVANVLVDCNRLAQDKKNKRVEKLFICEN